MSSNGDDELERRLRDVLHDRGLGVPVPPEAIGRIHAGARRRQQQRSGASVLGAVAVIAIAAVGIGVRSHDHGPTNIAAGHTTSPSQEIASASSPAPWSATAPIASPTGVPSGVASAGVVESSGPAFASTPPVPIFNPVSVSAIGVHDYWVLGFTDYGVTTSTTVLRTTDAGMTFTTVGRPDGIIGTISRGPPGSDTNVISDIRFGDANNGWVYGNELSETADGGVSWSPVTGVPGDVVDLAAASGNVWAIAARTADGSSPYALYHATYGPSGTGAWTQVNLGVLAAGSQPSIAVIKTVAYVLVSRDTAPSVTYVVTNGGGAHTPLVGPCGVQQDVALSVAGDGSIWAVCNLGHSTEEFVSTSLAKQWQQVNGPYVGALGGVDATHAVACLAASGFALISADGASAPVTLPTPETNAASFIGFTTTSVGFMISNGQSAAWQLSRTTDGGRTWTAVAFPS